MSNDPNLPDHPYLADRDQKPIPITDKSPVSWHFLWIKVCAAWFISDLDTIFRKHERQRMQRYVSEAQQINDDYILDYEHSRRLTLIAEIEAYMPELRIPILSDRKWAWQWGHPIPDREKFIAELEEIKFQANLRWRKALAREAKSEKQAGAALERSSSQRKRGRPDLPSHAQSERNRLLEAWERAKGAKVRSWSPKMSQPGDIESRPGKGRDEKAFQRRTDRGHSA